MKFKKFANLNWMKEAFNVHAHQLMDFQMMRDGGRSSGIGGVVFKP